MSTDNQNPNLSPVPIEPPLSIRDLTIVLIKHYEIHEGCYDLLVEFQIGVGAVGPAESLAPGAMIGVSRVGLTASKAMGLTSVDASLVNPASSSTSTKVKPAAKKPVAKARTKAKPVAKKPAATK